MPLQRLRYRVIAMMLFLAYWALPIRTPAGITSANYRKAAPDFTLGDSKGASIRLSDYKGKVVLLDFWATWCSDCKTEIPWYIEFENRYKSSGLAVIGVSMDSSWELVKPFLEQQKMNYTVVMSSNEVTKLYGVRLIPMTLLIDRDGRVADYRIGVIDKNAFESEIHILLHESAKNTAK
jgi:cytochrome c biogenesis protein CcmG/thiol:disulfide interchange protein DsbE